MIEIDIKPKKDVNVKFNIPVQTISGETVSDYNQLNNKPKINNIELAGNKTLDELGIQSKGDYLTKNTADKTYQEKGSYALKSEIPTKTSQLNNDSNLVEDSNYVHTDNNFTDEDKAKLDSESSNEQWKLINTIDIGENTSHIACNADSDGNAFAYKEIKIVATNVLGTNAGNFAVTLYNHTNTENSVTRMFTGVLLANAMNATKSRHFFIEITRETNEKILWFDGCFKVSSGYTATKNEMAAIISQTDEHIRKIDIYFSGSNVCNSGLFKIYGRKKVSS